MDQQQEQKKSGSLLNDLQSAQSNLRIGRFLISQGGKIAAGLLGGMGWPVLVAIGLVLLLTLVVGFAGIPGGSGGTPSPQPSQPPISITPPDGPTPTPGGDTGRACTRQYEGIRRCSVENLKAYFGNNEGRAVVASLICQAESISFPFSLNDNCQIDEKKGNEYSVGLFQINLVAHCGGAYANPRSCNSTLNRSKRDVCEQRWRSDTDENIKFAAGLSQGGSVWDQWGTWLDAGHAPPVRDTVTKCGIQY